MIEDSPQTVEDSGQIKGYMSSRWSTGYIVEIDYSSLEVYGAAMLSQDEVLINDLLSGIDMHKKMASLWKGIPESEVTKPLRTAAKKLSFQLQYGAGSFSMSKKLGVPQEECQQFIDTYYERYFRLKEWQQDNIEYVRRHAQLAGHDSRTPSGKPARIAKLPSPTGREYTFVEEDAPDWLKDKGIYTSFGPTYIKNYPIQGIATGDIVPLVIGKLVRALFHLRKQVKLINTVHDSVYFDFMMWGLVVEWVPKIKEIMEPTHVYLRDMFGYNEGMLTPVEIQVGKNMLEMEVYEVET